MKEIGTEELKKLQIDILLSVHQFCLENNIDYSLDSGTLLGAIRHKGYIPWDDDIDIIMTRPNYDRFINGFNGAFDNYYVLAPEINWNFYAPYANVCDSRTLLLEESVGHNKIDIGVKIDVFPIDGCQDDYNEYLALHKKLHYLNTMLYSKRAIMKYYMYNNIKRACALLYWRLKSSIKSYSEIQKNISLLSTQFKYDKSNFATLFVFPFFPLHMKKTVFESFVDVDFEGHKFKGIKEYDTYLTALYGDYMQLPPEEERVYQHGFSAFWK